MKKVTRYYRKMQGTFLKVATAVSLVVFLLIPTISNNSDKLADAIKSGAYKVFVNDVEMGCVATQEEATKVYLDARDRLNKAEGGIAFVDAQMSIVEVNNKNAVVSTPQVVEDKIYSYLSQEVILMDKVTSYTIRIEDFTVTVASKEDVIKVLEQVKSKYDVKDTFQVSLSTAENGSLEVDMQSAEIVPLDVDKVSAVLKGETITVDDITEETTIEEGLIALGFAEKIEILQTRADEEDIVSVEDAYNAITKETEERETYTIQTGDCLYNVAVDHGMTLEQLLAINEGLKANSVIREGDKVIVTVPTPELSIVTAVIENYEEEYNAPIQYVDDPTLYKGQTAVSVQGKLGYREVDAIVTYKNGTAISKQVINQVVVEEPVAKVIRRGTKEAPTYIVPIARYTYISEEFGWIAWRGRNHYGMDFAAPTGTVIRASRSGTVIYSGWKSGYGYCVEISHGDGHTTMYAHMSKLAVTRGQYVSQWETIGYCGSTGNSTGPHLHFEIRANGVAVNPRKWIKF